MLRCNSDHQAVITCNETFESCNDPMSFWPCESLYFKSSVCFCPILMGVFLVSGGRSNPWTGAAAHFSAHVDVPPAGEHCSTTLMILTEIAVCSRSSFIHWPLHFVNIFCCKCTNNSSYLIIFYNSHMISTLKIYTHTIFLSLSLYNIIERERHKNPLCTLLIVTHL